MCAYWEMPLIWNWNLLGEFVSFNETYFEKSKQTIFLPYQNGTFGILYVFSEQKINGVHYERQTRTNSAFSMLTYSHQE